MGFAENLKKLLNQIYLDKVIFLTILLVIIGVISLAVMIITYDPEKMRENFNKWMILIYNNYLLFSVIILSLVGILYLFIKFISENVPLYSYSQNTKFQHVLQPLIKNGSTIRIFCYTSETLTNYISWNDLRTKDINIYLLLRDWNIECTDEMTYNNQLDQAGDPRGRWKKAHIIYNHSMQLLNTPGIRARIYIRFYKEYPKFKGIIIETSESITYAFLGLFDWIEDTSMKENHGGSQYVGDKGGVVFLCSNRGDLEKNLLKRYENQFEHLWKESLLNDFNHVAAQGIPNKPPGPCR